jgi:hypothetical protein
LGDSGFLLPKKYMKINLAPLVACGKGIYGDFESGRLALPTTKQHRAPSC